MALNYLDINNFVKAGRQLSEVTPSLFSEFGVPKAEWPNWGFAVLSPHPIKAKENLLHLVVVRKGTDNCIGPICNFDVDLGTYVCLTAAYNEVEIRDFISQIQSRGYHVCGHCASRLYKNFV